MMNVHVQIDFRTLMWRYIIIQNRLILNISKNFANFINDIISIYTLICSIEIKNDVSTTIFIEITNFENVFFFKFAIILLEHDEHNYAINLIFNKTFSHKSLYNMSQKKFETLQKYVRNNLVFEKIKHSMINVDSFVFFIF